MQWRPFFLDKSLQEMRNKILTSAYEISQEDNLNANARLWVCPNGTVLKCYVKFDSPTENNIHNLLTLSKMRRLHQIPQLAMPLEILRENGAVVGYTMPFCPGIPLEQAMIDSSFSSEEILDAFIALATVINRLPWCVFIGDLHAQNVLVEPGGEIHIIDLDGFSVFPKYQLTCPMAFFLDHELCSAKKYRHRNGMFKVSRNTDIFSFFVLFLQWVMGTGVFFSYTTGEMYRYFTYLERHGFPTDVLDMIYQLFRPGRNRLLPEHFRQIDLSRLSEYRFGAFVKDQMIQKLPKK